MKNLNANAEKGSLLSIIGFVVIKADDQSKIKNKYERKNSDHFRLYRTFDL